jgi:hypothetical protein
MNAGQWVVLAMVFVMGGLGVGLIVAWLTASLFWTVVSGILAGLVAAGVVVWVSNELV